MTGDMLPIQRHHDFCGFLNADAGKPRQKSQVFTVLLKIPAL